MPVFPCQLGTSLCSRGDQSLGWCKGDGGNRVLRQWLGNQTTRRLKITVKPKASSAELILKPEWVLGWLGELRRPFLWHETPSPRCAAVICPCRGFTAASPSSSRSLRPRLRKKGCWGPGLALSKQRSEFKQSSVEILFFKFARLLKLSSFFVCYSCTTEQYERVTFNFN